MPQPTVVVAGTGFNSIRQFLTAAFPDVRLDMIDPSELRRDVGAQALLGRADQIARYFFRPV